MIANRQMLRTTADPILCPKCGADIAAALTSRVTEEVRGQVAAEGEAKVRALEEQMEDRLRQATVKAQEDAKSAIAAHLLGKEKDLQAKEGQLKKAREDLEAAKATELRLLQESEAVAQAKKDVELTVARRLKEERARVEGAARQSVAEEYQLQIRERDEKEARLLRTIDELKQKAEQGSQQSQGEALETSLEDVLRREFLHDALEPVPKGARGGDVVQRVRNAAGQDCGLILWESKRTRAWANDWLPKLRDDKRAIKAHLAVLVTHALPRGAPAFSCIDGVWVSTTACFLGLAHALRQGMVDLTNARQSQEGRSDKMELLYGYLTGQDFRSRIEGIVEPFRLMQEGLAKERVAMQQIWARREKEIQRALLSASGMYGDLQGIAAGALPELPQLALPDAEDGEA
jgi:hypothetical protein